MTFGLANMLYHPVKPGIAEWNESQRLGKDSRARSIFWSLPLKQIALKELGARV